MMPTTTPASRQPAQRSNDSSMPPPVIQTTQIPYPDSRTTRYDIAAEQVLSELLLQKQSEERSTARNAAPASSRARRQSPRIQPRQVPPRTTIIKQRLKHRSPPSYQEATPPESARPLEQDASIAIPLSFAKPSTEKSTGIIAHLFYPETAHEICRIVANIPGPKKLYVSTCSASARFLIAEILSHHPAIAYEIQVVENRGRDLPSKTSLFVDRYRQHDYLLFVHGKKSTHADVLQLWRSYNLETLAGTPEIVDSIHTLFAANERLGIVAPQHFEPMRHWVNWGANFPATRNLVRRAGVEISRNSPSDFPAGCMFWARPAALQKLVELQIQPTDYPPENGKKDGTLAHAVERAIYYLCEAAGYSWLKVALPSFCPNTPAMLTAETPEDLASTVARANFSLLKPAPGFCIRSQQLPPIGTPAAALADRISRLSSGQAVKTPHAKRLAIGIVTFNNTEAQLHKSLRALTLATKRSLLSRDHTVFVVHNGAPVALAVTENIRERQSPVNAGFGATHNRLMREAFDAGFDCYLTLNPDGLLHPDAIDHLIRSAYATPETALVEALQFPCEHPKFYDEHAYDTAWVSGACLLMTREIMAKTGGFDDQFFMYCEDVDLSWRAKAAGFRSKTVPQALYLHEVSNRSLPAATLKMILESSLVLARKWRHPSLEQWALDLAATHAINLATPTVAPAPSAWIEAACFENMTVFSPKRW